MPHNHKGFFYGLNMSYHINCQRYENRKRLPQYSFKYLETQPDPGLSLVHADHACDCAFLQRKRAFHAGHHGAAGSILPGSDHI